MIVEIDGFPQWLMQPSMLLKIIMLPYDHSLQMAHGERNSQAVTPFVICHL